MYRRHRIPPDVIAHAVWLCFRFPPSLRMVEDMLAERGIIDSHQTIRMWAEKFGWQYANNIRRNTKAAKRLMLKLLKLQGAAPRVMITDKLRSYGAAKWEIMPGVEHRSHKGLNNRAENFHPPTRRRERIMKRFKSVRHLQHFVSIHDPIANLFHLPRHEMSSTGFREMRSLAMQAWREIARIPAA